MQREDREEKTREKLKGDKLEYDREGEMGASRVESRKGERRERGR